MKLVTIGLAVAAIAIFAHDANEQGARPEPTPVAQECILATGHNIPVCDADARAWCEQIGLTKMSRAEIAKCLGVGWRDTHG